MTDTMQMLQLQKCWAILITPPYNDDPKCLWKGCRVFPSLEDAKEAYVEAKGVELKRDSGACGDPNRQTREIPAGIFEFDLPHSWLYDTKPHHAGWYQFRANDKLEGRLVHSIHA